MTFRISGGLRAPGEKPLTFKDLALTGVGRTSHQARKQKSMRHVKKGGLFLSVVAGMAAMFMGSSPAQAA